MKRRQTRPSEPVDASVSLRIPANIRTMLVQHMGLGDAVVCNALTRELLKRYPAPVGIFVKPSNRESIAWMYRDLGAKVVLLDAGERPPPSRERYADIWEACDAWHARTCGSVVNVSMFRENRPDYCENGTRFDACFYRYAGVPLRKKWSGFLYKRDATMELEPPQRPYALIHDDPSRGYFINPVQLPNMPRYHMREWKTSNAFALRRIAEAADEIHCINSAFLNLFDFWEPQGRLFWHYYSRIWEGQSDPALRLPWTLLNESSVPSCSPHRRLGVS